MIRVARRCLPLAVLLAALAVPSGAGAASGPTAEASRTCGVGDSQSYGTTYVLGIRARNVSCRRARRLVREFHDCRPGKTGRCPRVSGYRCREDRFRKIPTQYSSRVTCRRGGKVVKHTYQQWL
ncbi:MAG TPA: hypothetical protein VK307_12725 [Thermoleophilaceae bacterium]|nr:hypothetical protein [Thermoleophilaceae bacterium]